LWKVWKGVKIKVVKKKGIVTLRKQGRTRDSGTMNPGRPLTKPRQTPATSEVSQMKMKGGERGRRSRRRGWKAGTMHEKKAKKGRGAARH